MLKLFLDTNILVSATFWKGSSYKLTLKIIEGKLLAFTTNQILREYRIILKRDFHLTEEEVDARVEKLLEFLEVVRPTVSLDVVKADPDDNKILEGALEAAVNFIVSYDQHLLSLKNFGKIMIVKPEEILKSL